MAFIPLVSLDRVIGKFMLYYAAPARADRDEMELAGVIAAQVAFALERTRAEEQARRSEERLRFALDAALMGTWDWDLVTNGVRWSDNLEADPRPAGRHLRRHVCELPARDPPRRSRARDGVGQAGAHGGRPA